MDLVHKQLDEIARAINEGSDEWDKIVALQATDVARLGADFAKSMTEDMAAGSQRYRGVKEIEFHENGNIKRDVLKDDNTSNEDGAEVRSRQAPYLQQSGEQSFGYRGR